MLPGALNWPLKPSYTGSSKAVDVKYQVSELHVGSGFAFGTVPGRRAAGR